MSMDLILFTACALNLPADLPNSDSWKNYGGTDWAYEISSWQVIVDIDKSYEIPKEAKNINNNLDTSILLTLEPIGANEDGYRF